MSASQRPSRQPGDLSASERATILSTPLGALRFPARMNTFFEKKGLSTVGELVAFAPASLLVEPNLGRKSVADTRRILRERFQMSWETLQRSADGGPYPTVDHGPRTPAEEWAALGRTIPLELAERDLSTTDVPARMLTHARRFRLRTVGELLAMPYAEVDGADNVGVSTLRGTLDEITRLRGPVAVPSVPPAPVSTAPDPLPAGSHWKDLLRRSFRELPANERLVVTQRSGLAGPVMTLQEVGECLGFSRERARQLEEQAIKRVRAEQAWVPPAAARLLEACPADLCRLTDVKDELLSTTAEDVEPFAFFVDDILDVAVRVVRVDEVVFLSRLPRSRVEALVAALRLDARSLAFPFPAGQREKILAAGSKIEKAIVDVLSPFLAEEWIEEDGQVRGFGSTRRSAVLAWVRALGRPVRRVELDEKFGRINVPAELVLVDWGLFALPEQIPDWDRWAARMPTLVKSILEELGPERQWTTKELFGPVSERAELPEWLNEWGIGSLVRDSAEVRYLGRNVVALPDVADDRLQVHELATSLLERAGGALAEGELVEALGKSRGMGKNTWPMMRTRRPFLLFDDGRVGLEPRDQGAPPASVEALREETFRLLDAKQRGLSAVELRDVIARHGLFDRRLARSLLRHDGRFRLAQGGAVGLAEWEDARASTQADVLRDLLIEHEGIVPVELAMELLPTASGDPLSRERVGLLANSIRARLVGPCIEWMPEMDTQTVADDLRTRVVASLPEAAAALFVAYLGDVKDAPTLADAKLRWLTELRGVVGDERSPVDRMQVERLNEMAENVLERLAAAEIPEQRALYSAALQYLVAIDDGISDLVFGGLDDDERVLEVVLRKVDSPAL